MSELPKSDPAVSPGAISEPQKALCRCGPTGRCIGADTLLPQFMCVLNQKAETELQTLRADLQRMTEERDQLLMDRHQPDRLSACGHYRVFAMPLQHEDGTESPYCMQCDRDTRQADLQRMREAVSPTHAADWPVAHLVLLAQAHREDSESVDRHELPTSDRYATDYDYDAAARDRQLAVERMREERDEARSSAVLLAERLNGIVTALDVPEDGDEVVHASSLLRELNQEKAACDREHNRANKAEALLRDRTVQLEGLVEQLKKDADSYELAYHDPFDQSVDRWKALGASQALRAVVDGLAAVITPGHEK